MVVESGEVLGLIGPNGAGKTTVIDLISGLSRADSGTVMLNNRDMTRSKPDYRTRMGLVRTFQESPAVPGLSVLEHIQLSLEAIVPRQRDSSASTELLERFDLYQVRNEMGTELPTIQRRLLDFVRAVAARPKVLLLDEPFAGLVRHEVKMLMDEIKRLKKTGVSVVIIEHRLALLNEIADSAVALVKGTPVAAGQLDVVLADSVVREAFLGIGHNQTGEVTYE